MQFTVLEASRRLSQLIRSAQAGEEVLIAENGEPVARLVAASPAIQDDAKMGRGSAILAWLSDHPVPMEACRSAEEIDAAIEAERNAWE